MIELKCHPCFMSFPLQGPSEQNIFDPMCDDTYTFYELVGLAWRWVACRTLSLEVFLTRNRHVENLSEHALIHFQKRETGPEGDLSTAKPDLIDPNITDLIQNAVDLNREKTQTLAA